MSQTPGIEIENLDQARFECVFPTCGGICCQNGRPGVEPGEAERIEANLERFLPHLRPGARKAIARGGFLTRRVKAGRRTLAVQDSWCVFFNEGCVLHKVGAEEGDRWRYKPWHCVTFPLERAPGTKREAAAARARWYIRQWRYKGEGWDLFCLNPRESPKRAADTLAGEIEFAEGLEQGREDWRKLER